MTPVPDSFSDVSSKAGIFMQENSHPAARNKLMPRWLIVTLVAGSLTLTVAIAFWTIVMAPFARREADAKIAFSPLFHLDPEILTSGFGVFHVKFHADSKLTDENVSELLALNRLPAKYELTLWLRTPAISDASVPVLSKLTTTDAIIFERTNLTEKGMKQLTLANPYIYHFTADGNMQRYRPLQP